MRYKITKINQELFFLKLNAIVWMEFEEGRIYSEDRKEYMPIDTAIKATGLDGEIIE